MWKKIVVIGAVTGLAVFSLISPGATVNTSGAQVVTVSDNLKTETAPFEVEGKSAVLIDGTTGKVLMEQNSHQELPLASVTKVMTMLLVMEAVEEGKINLDDQVTISEHASSMGGSQMFMEAGEVHTVEELLMGVAMASANDGCVALAEYVAGTEEIFVERMNARAGELGMRDTHFVNTNGLPVADHYSSAYDIGVMSKELYRFSQVRKWFTTWQADITIGLPGKEKEFGLTNTNKLIKTYSGCDGIKTGYTSDAGYCLSASATRGDTHLIAVILGCETSAVRNGQISKMFDYGFANFQSQVVAEAGDKMCKISLDTGSPQVIDGLSGERIMALVKKGEEDQVKWETEIFSEIKLPLEKGDKVGKIIVRQGEEVKEYPLIAGEKVGKASFKSLLERKFKSLGEDVK